MYDRDTIWFSVNSQIMINTTFFWKVNPNYSRLYITELVDSEMELALDRDFIFRQVEEPADEIQSSKGLADIKKNDLLICCPTVLGFSLNDKIWGEILLYVVY